jgi:uncharacterized protein YcbK (DUF882 family)
MQLRRLILLAALAFALALPAARDAWAGETAKKSAAKSSTTSKKSTSKKKKKGRGKFVGHGVAKTDLRAAALPKASGRIELKSPALGEAVDVTIYNDDGSLNQSALAKLDKLFRCRRTDEERAVDPRLYEILALVYDHFGKQVHINSGFRYQRNEGSRHFHASAMDISIDGVSYKDIYKFAETLDTGGMGIGQYPYSGFVHIDFRAPGEASYRWTDTKRGGKADSGKLPSKMWKSGGKPNS